MDSKDIQLIMSQTTYTFEEATEKLAIHKDPMSVVCEYMNPVAFSKEKEKTTKAKSKYTEFRNMLKEPARRYEREHPIDVNYVAQCFAESDRRVQEREQQQQQQQQQQNAAGDS